MAISCANRTLSVIDEIIKARERFGSYHSNLVWGIINSVLAVILYLELSFGSIINFLANLAPYLYIWYLALGLQILFVVNVLYHFSCYIKTQSLKPIEVSTTHRKLCRIGDRENGFCSSPTFLSGGRKSSAMKNFSTIPNFSPSNYNSFLSFDGSGVLDNSWEDSFHSLSFDHSYMDRSQSSFHSFEKDDHGLNLSPGSSIRSYSPRNCIDSANSLRSFLKQQSDSEMRLRRVEQAFENTLSHKFARGLETSLEGISNRFQYQLARSLQLPPHLIDVPQDSVSCSPTESDIWSKLNISQDKVDLWTERLRKYLGQTILVRLTESIHSVNKALISAGHEDVQIGAVNLATLKHISASRSHIAPQLPGLIPFLEASTNQEYLVQRIRELSSGGCISSLKWSSGGEFRGKKWEENLPTDSALLMHFLCCYLDSRLPSHPKYLDGKTFTSQHFFRAIDKPNMSELKDSVYFHEASVNPPHYDIISEGSVIHVKKGRPNLFHAILLFFYFIKTKEHGMLRRVSLGLSGINILWIFDD